MSALRSATRFINAPVSPSTLRGTSPLALKAVNMTLAPRHDDHHDGPTAGHRVGTPSPYALKFGRGSSRIGVNAPASAPHRRSFHSSPPAARDPVATPDFTKYRASNPAVTRNVSYFMVGSMGVLSAAAAKSTVVDLVSTLSASADVLALAKLEVSMSSIPEGKNVIVKWRGKPVFIRHRTADEIAEANAVDVKSLRDPQEDAERTKQPEWLVMVGVCTHLGCVPIGEAGDFGGWFCPCHGSHYDISGRIRRGPAPLNLEIPEYAIDEGEGVITVG